MSSTRSSHRKRALADAAAGVVGSLFSMLCFYPVDVYKTSLQAAAGDDDDDGSRHQSSSSMQKKRCSFHQLSMLSVADLFRGLHHKVAHTIVSSFTYFYVYSLVTTKYLSYRRGNNHHSQKLQQKTSTIAKLILTAFSAMINTAITLPFDTISSRIQAGRSNELSNSEEQQIQSIVARTKLINGVAHKTREEEKRFIKKFSLNTNLPKEAFERGQHEEKRTQQLRSVLSLWNGLLPAILLCTNPAIQYTMFENLKGALLQHRMSQQQQQQHHQGGKQQKGLTMWQAFVFGLISKFFATIMTYPLIRAKVMLMVSSPDVFDDDDDDDDINGDSHHCSRVRTSSGHTKSNNEQSGSKKHPRSLPLLLVSIFRNDGMRGLYRGCSVQLLHTIMKSALMLMIRERITQVCHNIFLDEDAA